MLRSLYKYKSLRSIFLPVVKLLSPGDIRITHHFTKKKLLLDFFKHKGYWYHGKNRERSTIDLFYQLIKPDSTVIEVGAHIGYLSQLFGMLVGPRGRVVVFEPGENNLPYTRKNISVFSNITLVEKAISDFEGEASFYVENLTGQNNSLLQSYETFKNNIQNAHVDVACVETKVQVIRLDDYVAEHQLSPALIKIDVEGAEFNVLSGMDSILKQGKSIIMVEVTERTSEVQQLLAANGYLLYDPEQMKFVDTIEQDGNFFCLHSANHASIIQTLKAVKA